MFDAKTTPIERLSEPVMATTVAVAWLETSALISASSSACTSTAPSASTVELWMYALACAAFWAPKALAISGSPSSVSIALKRKFWEFQPIELKASVTPADWPALSEVASVVASICAVFSAVTRTSPVVVTSLSAISASVLASTTLVAIIALTASEAPWASIELPPEELTVASAVARSSAVSAACTVREAALTALSRT